MFKRSDYLKDTPKAVIDLIEAASKHDYLDEEGWGDDVADAVWAAQWYASVLPLDQQNDYLQDKVLEATAEWNEEGDLDATMSALTKPSGFRPEPRTGA